MNRSQGLRGGKNEFPDRKLNLLTKLFLATSVFIGIGFIVFILALLLSNAGVQLQESVEVLFFAFLYFWGLVLAYMLPFGLITVGVWSIHHKEAVIKGPLSGADPIFVGIFYLILGGVLLWGVNGVVVSFLCNGNFCPVLPSFVKFF